MAIGTLTAIGLGLGAVGAIASSSAQKKAANTAAQTAQNTTDANNALARDIYGQNKAALSPFMQRGNVAGDYINAMLGIPSTQIGTMGGQQSQPTYQPNQAVRYGEDYGFSPTQVGMVGGDYRGQVTNGGFLPQRFSPTAQGNMTASGGISIQPQGVTTQNAQDAFKQYIQNSDYGFQFGQGSNAVNSGYAGAGTLQSGAAMRAMEKYRQDLQSGYRGEYMNALGNQQGVGLSGANALAGVSTNFGNTIAANNNAAGTAAANAALAKGNNSFGNVLGMIGGGLYGYGSR